MKIKLSQLRSIILEQIKENKEKQKIKSYIKKILNEDPELEKMANYVSKNMNRDYTSFVGWLKQNIGNEKLQNFLSLGGKDGVPADEKFDISNTKLSVSKLVPTQNEIDVKKSLQYPLTDLKSAQRICSNAPITIMSPIITYAGKYIIDGHHRWSQVCAINPNAQMTAYNITQKPGYSPIDVLKVTQIAIGLSTDNIKVANVEGQNLLEISLQSAYDFMQKILKNIEIVNVLWKFYEQNSEQKLEERKNKNKSGKKDRVLKQIVKNIELMQSENQPIPKAPKRDVMPQTDTSDNWDQYLQSGVINYEEPFFKNDKQ